MDNATQALMMAFSAFVFVFALTLAMYLIIQVQSTAEVLAFRSDSTRYYDNVELVNEHANMPNTKGTVRIVNAETIIPTLYRYNKENFCVKIYDADGKLIQIFDVNLENKVFNAISDTKADEEDEAERKANNALKKVYDNKNDKGYYLFGAPWTGSAEHIKTRIDLFVSGKAGYINNQYVDYTNNEFYNSLSQPNIQYIEEFISYSYTGDTLETEDGEVLVTGASAKDKIVIVYTMINM